MIFKLYNAINFNSKNYSCFTADALEILLLKYNDCKIVKGNLKVEITSPIKSKELILNYKYLPNNALLPIVSDSLYKVLKPLLKNLVQFKKVIVNTKDNKKLDYYIINILSSTKIIDYKKSKCLKVYGDIIGVNNFSLLKNYSFEYITREKIMDSFIFVDEKMKNILESNSPKTVFCKEIFPKNNFL